MTPEAVFTDEKFKRAMSNLRQHNAGSKITPEARKRCAAAHTMAEQMQQLRRATDWPTLNHDQDDVTVAFSADKAWSGQHVRLTMPIDGAD